MLQTRPLIHFHFKMETIKLKPTKEITAISVIAISYNQINQLSLLFVQARPLVGFKDNHQITLSMNPQKSLQER